ncbi:MAG TPA: SMI1/KNR4 family protein [Polyangiaceae bacterium]|nr:SMI1/KNR4 family protein [Polyangiaceae bacterium]
MSNLFDLVGARLVREIRKRRLPSRNPVQTEKWLLRCEKDPDSSVLGELAWDHVANLVWAQGITYTLPGPASMEALAVLRSRIEAQFHAAAPELLFALLSLHDGLSALPWTAFFSTQRILEYVSVLQDVDASLLTIASSPSGNKAVLRIHPGGADDGCVYAFWHEDFRERGLKPIAPSVVEYLAVSEGAILDTVEGHYEGPDS